MGLWDVIRTAVMVALGMYVLLLGSAMWRDMKMRRARNEMAYVVLRTLRTAEERGMKAGVISISLDDDGGLLIKMKREGGENHAVQTDGNTGRDADNAGCEQ